MSQYPDLFVITSVINTGTKPWSYTRLRSCYTKEDRFKQTLNTIKTIRDLNDNTKIMLVECSDIDENMTNILKENVDYFIQTYEYDDVRAACLDTNKKGFGEVKKLEKACEYIINNNIIFNRLFKISGRYYLNDKFNKDNYNQNDMFTFKMNTSDNGSTVLYSVPYKQFNLYINKLKFCINFYENNPPTGLEMILPIICLPRQDILTLGVSGQVGVLNPYGVSELYIA